MIALIIYFASVTLSCLHHGSICPSTAPCCGQEGYCGTGNNFCAIGCQRGNSFQESCFKRPRCISRDFSLLPHEVVSLHEFKDTSNSSGFVAEVGRIKYGTDGMTINLDRSDTVRDGRRIGEGSRVSSMMYVDYGTVEARVKASSGVGVVTGFILMADNKDEIDFEWLGRNTSMVLSNYFYRGVLDYSNGIEHKLPFDVTKEFHDYKFVWRRERIEWFVDGTLLRTLYRNATINATSSTGYVVKYPDEESRVRLSIWDGASLGEGTRKWAGETDWETNERFSATFQWIKVQCANPHTSNGWRTSGFNALLLFALCSNKYVLL